MNEGIVVNHHRFNRVLVNGLLAMSVTLTGACDSDSEPPADPVVSMRSADEAAPAHVAGMGLGDGESWAVLDSGNVKGWGDRFCDGDECLTPAQTPTVDLDGPAVEVHGNGEYSVALMADGTVKGWGPSASDIEAPQPVAFPGIVTALGLGEDFLCAQLDDGTVQCQGIDGTPAPAWIATFALPGPVADLSAGAHHACARTPTGDVTCWGNNDSGQLGSPGATGPTSIPLSGAATQVAAGGAHTCARIDDGTMQCWGNNDEDQLGHALAGVGTVPLADPIEKIAAGAEHTCAITEVLGDLYCWGSNALGQLGEGTDLPSGLRHVDLAEHGATEIVAGPTAWTTFAVMDHGGLRGWGDEDQGQTGYGEALDDGPPPTRAVGNLPDILILDVPDDV
ncbi:MAG: hypothetical protein AAGF11_33705 [Myxococcota bacterium]